MDETPAPAPPARACDNCGAQLLGEHCYSCGQPTKGLVRHFGSILGDFFDSVLNLDTRTMRTLPPLLFKPGYLTLEYFRGHRVRYVSPVRLFFFLCIAAFFAVALVVKTPEGDAFRGNDRIENAQTVEEAETARDEALAALATAREAIPDTPGARVGMDVSMELLKDQAEDRIGWLRERDAAIRDGKPVPPWEGTRVPESNPEDADYDGNDARQRAAAESGETPRRRGLRVRTTQFQFNDKPWDALTNPVKVDALGEQGNLWLNALVGRAQDNAKAINEKPRLLVEAFFGSLPQTLLVLLPVFALLLKLMYVFKRRMYMEHLIVALHSHAFLCASVLLLAGVDKARELLESGFLHGVLFWLEAAIWTWMPIYLLVMQKRVYRQGWIMTLLKYFILGTCYLVLLSVGAAITLAVSLVAM